MTEEINHDQGYDIRHSDQIRLECDVPHISIEPVGRQLKSVHAKREISLLGVSLEAFKAFPGGFTRYDGGPTVSQTINKYLIAKGLQDSPDHAFYSLRHSFQDRMIEAEVDDRIRRDLFGHTLTEERYVRGASLEAKAKVMAPLVI